MNDFPRLEEFELVDLDRLNIILFVNLFLKKAIKEHGYTSIRNLFFNLGLIK